MKIKRSKEQEDEMAIGRSLRALNNKLNAAYQRIDELNELTDEDIKVILTVHHEGLETIDGLADAHAVSRETIMFLTGNMEVKS